VRRGWFLPLVLVLLVSCAKTELYHNLSEDEVNEILVVLHENGISASKKKEIVQNEVTWTIAVESRDLPKARALLLERNLPRRKQPGIEDIYKDKGLIATADEQKARFIIGMRGNLINALRKNPDVIDADVVINVPDKEEFGTTDPAQKKRPSASLIIKVRPTAEGQATLTEAKLQRVVASAIPDMDPRDVTVIMSYVGGAPAGSLPGQSLPVVTAGGPSIVPSSAVPSKSSSTVTVAGVDVSPESSNRLKLYLGVFLGLLALLSIALIITVIHTHRVRQEARTPSTTVDGQLMGPDDNQRLGPG
jgi:type III secretion protein J